MTCGLWVREENLKFPRLEIRNDPGSICISDRPVENSVCNASIICFLDKFVTLMLPLEKDDRVCSLLNKVQN